MDPNEVIDKETDYLKVVWNESTKKAFTRFYVHFIPVKNANGVSVVKVVTLYPVLQPILPEEMITLANARPMKQACNPKEEIKPVSYTVQTTGQPEKLDAWVCYVATSTYKFSLEIAENTGSNKIKGMVTFAPCVDDSFESHSNVRGAGATYFHNQPLPYFVNVDLPTQEYIFDRIEHYTVSEVVQVDTNVVQKKTESEPGYAHPYALATEEEMEHEMKHKCCVRGVTFDNSLLAIKAHFV